MPNMTTTTGDVFIPEIWVDEVRAFLRANLVMGNLVKKINFVGKKGDTLHIPNLSELKANDKTANNEVTLQAPTEQKFTMNINKHKEVSFLIEDLLAIQESYDIRREYTSAAGYAIAKQMDSDLFALQSGLSARVIGGDGTTAWDPAANTNTGNGSDLTDAGIRNMIEKLDSANVPPDGRVMVIHPSQKNVLLGINRFTEQAFYGTGRAIQTGEFGEIYGVRVHVSTQTPKITAADGTTEYYVNLFFHPDAFILAQQLNPRVQANYELKNLGTLVVTDVVYGVAEYRDNHAVAFVTPV